MSYNATAIQIMIASPGDVLEERNLVRDILHEWNDLNSVSTNVVLMPVGWETHSSPDLGGRAQSLINKQVLDNCDLLVGIFWTRLGTPTGDAKSGTVEEIQRHIGAGKPAMVYFSTAPVAPQSLDQQQFSQLQEFKDWCKSKGLIEIYDNIADFREKFRRHIQITIRSKFQKDPSSSSGINNSVVINNDFITIDLRLSDEAKQLLIEASRDRRGAIMSLRFIGGQAIQTNGRNFADSGDRRSVARWEAALEQLLNEELIVPRGNKGEVFEITSRGFEVVDMLQQQAR